MVSISQKIEIQASSLQKKIDALSGERLTNTPKRMRQYRDRIKKRQQYQHMKQIVEYLGEELTSNGLNTLERALANRTFHEEMYSYLTLKKHKEENSHPYSPAFPIGNEKMAARLHKAGIHNTDDLLRAIEEYQNLFDRATIPRNTKADRIVELTQKARLAQHADIQFTPLTLAQELIKVCRINAESHVLEPEAGIGNIADEIKKITPFVDCIEIIYDFYELLKLKGHHLIGRDLFDCEPNPNYDAVIMNPPFSEECQQIQYAYGFLKPGGILASVCCSRMLYPKGKTYKAFYDWLERQNYRFKQVTAQFEKTAVQTVILIIYKPL